MERYHILLLEDDEALATSLKNALEAAGHSVQWVMKADEGLILVQRNLKSIELSPFDVVVTDLHLPGRVGIEPRAGIRLVTDLQKVAPRLPVVIMTAFPEAESAIEATKLGAYDYLLKPIAPPELLNLIEKAVMASRLRPAGEGPDQLGTGGETLIGNSRPMQNLYKDIGRLAATSWPVLIAGEPGTGKELVARTLHQHSNLADGPFVPVNCVGMSESALFSELSALDENGNAERVKTESLGVIEHAKGQTVFLNEISALSARVLEALCLLVRRPRPGSPNVREGKLELRLVAATQSDPGLLRRRCQNLSRGGEWLLGSLTRATIHVPPLRHRLDDLPPW